MKKLVQKIRTIEKEIVERKEIQTQLTEDEKKKVKKIPFDDLPYGYDALKTFINEETMDVHYNKHYKGYVDKANGALESRGNTKPLEDIVKNISQYNRFIRNNAGGAYNHSIFWRMMTPKSTRISGPVLLQIKKDFGSISKFKKEFAKVAKERFGSGWVWLIIGKDKKLKIMSTANQDNPLMNVLKGGGYPILGLDVWEHAYYLEYRNKRDDYVNNFWTVVNWDYVNERFNGQQKTKINESHELRKLINEQKVQGCTSDEKEVYRVMISGNSKAKKLYRDTIDSILKELFPEHWYNYGEYGPREMSGVYDLEKKGRSNINYVNTNYTYMCSLVKDVNELVKEKKRKSFKFEDLSLDDQIQEMERLTRAIMYFKNILFDKNSAIFLKMMSTVKKTGEKGSKTETSTALHLATKFGTENVDIIGELGSQEDALGGIDIKIKIGDEIKTGQIKDFKRIVSEKDYYTLYGTGDVKKYRTDWLIFHNGVRTLIFRNKNTQIKDGRYYFPKEDLLFDY